jgi:hypothetical protein
MGYDTLKFGWNSPSYPGNFYAEEGSDIVFLNVKEFYQTPEITN